MMSSTRVENESGGSRIVWYLRFCHALIRGTGERQNARFQIYRGPAEAPAGLA